MKKFIWIISIILLITLVFSCALVGCKEKEEFAKEDERRVVVVFEPLGDASVNDILNAAGLLYVTFIKNGVTPFEVKLVDKNKRIQLSIPDESDALKILRWIRSPMTFEIRKEGRDETLKSNPYVTNSDLQSANVELDDNGMFKVVLNFNEEGAKKFERATEERLNNQIHIWINGEWIMAPTVGYVISNGNMMLNWYRSFDEANEVATRIQIGAMKVKLRMYDMKTYPEEDVA